MQTYLTTLYDRLLEHRYRYYVTADSVITDFEYDWLERYYNTLVAEHGGQPMVMVGFDSSARSLEAKARVDAKADHYSVWLAEMQPVWNKLGYPKYKRATGLLKPKRAKRD